MTTSLIKRSLPSFIVLTLIATVLLSSINTESYVFGDYEWITGTSGAYKLEWYGAVPVEDNYFTVTKTMLAVLKNELGAIGKNNDITDVLSLISLNAYDPLWLRYTVMSDIINAPPLGTLLIFGHGGYDTSQGTYYEPYVFRLGFTYGTALIPPQWAVPTDVRVYAQEVAQETRTKPLTSLPSLIIAYTCSSAGYNDYYLNDNKTWAYAFRLSALDKPYNYYWAGRTFIGFAGETDPSTFAFINATLTEATMNQVSIGEAAADAAEALGVTLYIIKFESSTIYSTSVINPTSSYPYTAVLIGDALNHVDPTPEEIFVSKLVRYMKENTNFLYKAIVNGEMKLTKAKIEWNKIINIKGAQLTYESADITWKNSTMSVSVSAKALGNTIVYIHGIVNGNPENLASLSDVGIKWFNSTVSTLKSLGYEINGSRNEVSIGNAKYVELWATIMYNEIPILLSPPSNYAAIDITTKYEGENVSRLYFDIRLGNISEKMPAPVNEWELTPEDAVKAVGSSAEKTTVRRFWLDTETGLLPVYWVKYVDNNYYLHIYVIDATNGEIIAAWTTYVFGENGGAPSSPTNYIEYVWLTVAGIGILIVIWHYLIARKKK